MWVSESSAVDTCVPDNVAKCSHGFARHSDGSCWPKRRKILQLRSAKKKKNKIRNVQKCAREQLRFHKTPEILNNNKSEIYACV